MSQPGGKCVRIDLFQSKRPPSLFCYYHMGKKAKGACPICIKKKKSGKDD
ncbi:hypothetical protein C2W59_00366 [Bacillus pumilus]|uniref:Uncharacterized protein n=1 Tax=Bacillus pumilus TaxID=1408 RepID=A0AB34QY52_BACPU|nr:hypothetical protein B4127_2914 [Bacillus pumilus]RAP25404.1 hypothetical protein C2W59_00366 [Bacillus pumilus]